MLFRILILAGLTLVFAGCASRAERVWNEEDGHRWIDLGVRGGAAGFERLATSKTGVGFVNSVTEAQMLENQHTVNGSGVAVGDVDGDGWPDLYFARLDGPNALYRNLGGWRFEDITAQAGVAAPDRFSTGTAFADVDGDGDLDLLLTALGGPNALFLNDGVGRFEDVTEKAGLALHAGSTTMALADVDGDGDLDLYVGNYKTKTVRDLFPPEARAFERVVQRDGDDFYIIPEFAGHYRLHRYGNRLSRFEVGEPDRYYLNDGAGRFKEVPFTSGRFLDEDGEPLDEAPREWALTARFQDFNGDGLPDLYVCNDFESPDHLWLNEGDGRFRQASVWALRTTSHSTMAVAVADVNRDGATDFFLADMLSPDFGRQQIQKAAHEPIPEKLADAAVRPQVFQNTLFLGRSDGTFAEVAFQAGVAASGWTWGSTFADVDLDGYEDLLLATGHAYDAMDADTQMRTMQATGRDDWRRSLLLFPDLDLPNIAFRNLGGRRFEPMPDGWGLGTTPDVTHGLALADLDGDGDLDVVANRLGAEAGIYRNTSPAPRLAVRLRGAAPNTQGIGAMIRVAAPGLPVQRKEITAGGEYLSSSEALAVFAAGSPEGEVMNSITVEVRWRSGRCSRLDGVRGNRLYEIDEVGAGACNLEPEHADAPVFDEASELLDYTHAESRIDDFARQPLLPWAVSRRGPDLAAVDLDSDGDEDLVIGGSQSEQPAVFLNDGEGVLRRAPVAGEALPGGQASLAAMLLDGGGARFFVGVSNAAMALGDASFVAVYEADQKGRVREMDRLAFGAAGLGPLALGDFDGDGDLDLFAGGQAAPGRYPEAGPSRLYRNDDGRFVADEAMSAAFAHAGLIHGAAVGDLNRDGLVDLVLAVEWGPVRVFFNQGSGQFGEYTRSLGLDGYTGWWNDVALGDFDNDGRLDLVAANWGWNSKYGRPEENGLPRRLYYGDYDGNGAMDLVEARYLDDRGAYVPERGLKDLAQALPMIHRRVRSFTQYAGASLDNVLGEGFDRQPFLEAGTLGSMVFLNRGERFEAHPLPEAAQASVASGIVVADYDADGNDDLFLSQNRFGLPVETSRQDAGRGLWLRGDGLGGFVPVEDSGVAVYGEQGSAAVADYDGDGRVDLVVTQHGGPAKGYLNRTDTVTASN